MIEAGKKPGEIIARFLWYVMWAAAIWCFGVAVQQLGYMQSDKCLNSKMAEYVFTSAWVTGFMTFVCLAVIWSLANIFKAIGLIFRNVKWYKKDEEFEKFHLPFVTIFLMFFYIGGVLLYPSYLFSPWFNGYVNSKIREKAYDYCAVLAGKGGKSIVFIKRYPFDNPRNYPLN